TTQTDTTRIQTIYQPGTFAPLIRIETATGELTKAIRRTLAEKLQQDAGVDFVPELVAMLDNLECELQTGQLSDHSHQWLAQCGLTPEQMKNQMEPEYTPARKIHLYHCDHRGLPLALVSEDGSLAWQAEFDEWGNLLHEENPESLQQLIRLPGQQYDTETGLYYNRHRYYDPRQGRYITQDPIGLAGGWHAYNYPLNPLQVSDPLGLAANQQCTVDPITGQPVGRFITDSRGNIMMEPIDGSTGPYPPSNPNSPDTHTFYKNGSNAYRLNPQGHKIDPTPHAHAHAPGSGTGRSGQGASLGIDGSIVSSRSAAAHFSIKGLTMLSTIEPLLHMFTLRSCNAGSVSQCFCALTAEAEIGSESADNQCSGEIY
ncbi:RHS repeat-associated core domain-containing protein, partial [Lelliottia sp. V104_15]